MKKSSSKEDLVVRIKERHGTNASFNSTAFLEKIQTPSISKQIESSRLQTNEDIND